MDSDPNASSDAIEGLSADPRLKQAPPLSLHLVVTAALLVGLPLSLLSVRAASSPYQAVGPAETRPDSRVAQLDTDPVFAGAGDIGAVSGDGDEYTARVLDTIFAGDVFGEVFTAGDNMNEATAPYSYYTNYFDPTWGRHKAAINPSAGNHDYYDTGGVGQGYFDYFNGIGNFTGPAGDRDKGYYSYDLGTWHIVVINSNCSKAGGCGVGSPQEEWLRADLAAHPTDCTAAYWHHPRFSSGYHGNNSFMQPIWQALYDYEADVIVNGHDHDYERFAPQDPNGVADPVHGIREFVSGTGGAALRGLSVPRPNSEVFNATTWGTLKFTLHPTSFDWQFVPVTDVPGMTFTDSGSQSCHVTAPTPTPTPTPIPVGGIAEVPDVSESAGHNWVALAAVAAGAILALTAGAWYARRRWGR